MRMEVDFPPGTDSAGSFSRKDSSFFLATIITPCNGAWTLGGARLGDALAVMEGPAASDGLIRAELAEVFALATVVAGGAALAGPVFVGATLVPDPDEAGAFAVDTTLSWTG
jgi:hypothetical protein